MKRAPLVLAAVAIAAVSGTGGFMIGTHRNGRPADHNPSAVQRNPGPTSTGARNSQPAKTDFIRLRADLDNTPDPLERFKLALQHLESWINAEPVAALDWLSAQQPSARRNDVIRMAIGQFTENDPKGAAEWSLKNLTGIELNNSLILIAEEWARRDGAGAASWLAALPATPPRDAAMENLLFAWAADDPSSALKHLQSFSQNDPLSPTLRYAAYAGWSKTDPQAAVAGSLQSSRRHQDFGQFANTIANWATIDLTSSSRWLLSNVSDPTERSPAVLELATIFAHQSPESGLKWIQNLNPGGEQSAATNRLASEWSSAAPSGAAEWAAAQSPGTLSDHSISEILGNFLVKDPSAFEAWRNTLPDGPLKTQAAEIARPPPADGPH